MQVYMNCQNAQLVIMCTLLQLALPNWSIDITRNHHLIDTDYTGMLLK
jgi:hypothetical protein